MAEKHKRISRILTSQPVTEGAGVHLKRAFGYPQVPLLDPFLLLDDFHSANPDDYIAGFPWHPHRGIETITYMIEGEVEHGDSLGNKGSIHSGDVQWMTAGSGIIHQEMPRKYDGLMQGFQLWVNLPAVQKMMKPRYREIKKEQIPEITTSSGAKIKIISGEIEHIAGPVQDIVVDIEYLDVSLPPHGELKHPVNRGWKTFAYIMKGDGYFDSPKGKTLGSEHLVIFADANDLYIKAAAHGLRFLLISGEPIHEPVAWGGPIVMNTREELELAFAEYHKGTFIKH
jgi:hypothetical protein